MKRLWLFLIILLHASGLWAQISRDPGAGGRGRGPGDNQGQGPNFGDLVYAPDTLDVEYFYLSNPDKKFIYADTLVQYFHEFELSHIQTGDYFHLGFPGSPARPVRFEPINHTGFRLGLHTYDAYRVDEHNFRFYKLKKALTSAFYTQGQTQQDGIFRADFARDFKDGLQFALTYNRYNNAGFYNRQNGRGTALGIGFKYQSPGKRLQIFANHFSNIFNQENNGGITTDTLFNDEFFQERLAIPIALIQAVSRDQEKIYQIRTRYALSSQDSTRSDQGLLAEHLIRFDHRRFRFSDLEPDSAYYGPFMEDERGVRHFIDHRQVENQFNLSFQGKKPGQQFKVGLINRINNIHQEPVSSTLTEWRTHGRLDWNLGARIQLNARAEINFNRQQTGYLANGKIALDLGKAGQLQGSITLNDKPASLIERNLWLSQIQIWENDFRKTFTNHIRADYLLPSLRLHLTGGQILSTNQIYFDSRGMPVQESTLTTLNYLEIYKTFSLGKFYNENRITLQATGNRDVFAVPPWHTHHSIYFSGPIFRQVMNFKTGFDIRLNATYDGLTFRPYLGQFTLDEEYDIPFYPQIDYHAAFQVGFLRAFVLLQNILQPLRNDIYYQTTRYPQPDFLFRIGLNWIFIN